MKSKKSIYFLLPLVAIIWVYIFMQVFSYAGGETNIDTSKTNFSNLLKSSIKADTFSIGANYRDPFLDKEVKISKPLNANNNIVKVKTPPIIKDSDKWPSIIYNGSIKSQNKKQLALLNINGNSCMLSSGEAKDGLTILEILKDSVQIKFGSSKRFFRK